MSGTAHSQPCAVDLDDVFVPPIDVCAICTDVYCGGVECVSNLDCDDPDDQPMIETVQRWVRLGRAAEIAEALVARSEGTR